MMTSKGLLTNLTNKRVWLALWAVALALGPLFGQIDSTAVDTTRAPQRVTVDTQLGTVEGKKIKQSDGVNYPVEMRDPKKAALMSAVLPGLGQAYNKKYWKIPILYAGFGVAAWYLRDNLRNIQHYRGEILAIINDPSLDPTGQLRRANQEVLDTYYEWRDLSYIALAAIYILNIVDASVDAHLFYFDVSEDISMKVKPYWTPLMPNAPGLTFSFKL